MKAILAAGLVWVGLAQPGWAQYQVYKSKGGVVVVSEYKEHPFTLDIAGEQIVPVGMETARHPYFMVDGRFFQVMPVAIGEFKGDGKAGDEAVLRAQFKYESDNYPKGTLEEPEAQKLPSGRRTLYWTFTPAKEFGGKRQVFLTFRVKDYVVVLGSAVDGKDTAAAVRRFLVKSAGTFHATEGPVELWFAPDGSYERRGKAAGGR